MSLRNLTLFHLWTAKNLPLYSIIIIYISACYKIYAVWHETCLTRIITPEKEARMSTAIKDFAAINLLVIWFIVLGGFAILRIIKRKLED
jgi:hypothetical protein